MQAEGGKGGGEWVTTPGMCLGYQGSPQGGKGLVPGGKVVLGAWRKPGCCESELPATREQQILTRRRKGAFGDEKIAEPGNAGPWKPPGFYGRLSPRVCNARLAAGFKEALLWGSWGDLISPHRGGAVI